MRIFADDVFLEESVCSVVRRGGEANEKCVEVIEDLAPEVVDRPVAFVNDDEIKELRRNLVVVDDRYRLPGLRQLRWVYLFRGFVHLLALQERIHALDGANADLTIPGNDRTI